MIKTKETNKFLSAFLAVLILLSAVSVTAFAAEGIGGKTTLTITVPCTVTLQVGDHGKVKVNSMEYTGNDSFKAAIGTVLAYTFTPDPLYEVDKVTYNGTDATGGLSGSTYTAPALAGNAALSVSFKSAGGGGTGTYTVTFNMNGHGTAPANQTVNEGATATKPADPTASGWTFGGWYADAAFSARFDFNTAITADTTIYAKWARDTLPPAPAYAIIAGANGNWMQGSATGLSFTSNAPFAKFSRVEIDGSAISAANYIAEEGSTRIILKPSYLKILRLGPHTIRIVSSDGSASTNFTVRPPIPKTGDSSRMFLWLALLLVSGGAFVGMSVYGKKRKSE